MSGRLFLGLMSGTSLDGLDVALCEINTEVKLIAACCYPFEDELRSQALTLASSDWINFDQLLSFDNRFAQFCASAVTAFLSKHHYTAEQISAIGFHGQTLRHQPALGISLQSGNPSLLAEHTGIDVIADLRRRDLAAGGQGAPLAPAFHSFLMQSQKIQGSFLNLGGIANLTIIRNNQLIGFDTGPANILIDGWVSSQLNEPYDKDGAWGRSGQVVDALLERLLDEPYFRLPPPKSTGRELFNQRWLGQKLDGFESLNARDVQATLTFLTATTVASQLRRFADQLPDHLYLCGGGAKNCALVDALKDQLPEVCIDTTSTLGIDPDWVEAAAFAWLAARFKSSQPGNNPSVTGAKGPRILGALYPG